VALPIAAVAAGVGGFAKAKEAARRERNIADRVAKYAQFPEQQLRDIINTYGGEMGEAAQSVLNSRGSSAQTTAAAPTVTERLQAAARGGNNMILFAGAGLIALLLLRKR